MGLVLKRRTVIPGFGLSLGYAVTYLGLVVLLPLSTLFAKSAGLGWAKFWSVVTSDEVMAAYRMSFGASFLAAFFDVGIGLLVGWVLARYNFFGRRFVDALIDLPFALPTAVAGIALTSLWGQEGWLGSLIVRSGIKLPWIVWRGFAGHAWPLGVDWYGRVALAPMGVVVALMFIGLPFVIRTVQPVIQELGREVEEAAASLGASRGQTFRKIIFPAILPALVTGFALAFARGLGEYGSVLFISGNLPAIEIAPQQIVTRLEGYEVGAATAIAVVLLVVSFAMLLVINALQRVAAVRGGGH